MTLRQRAVPRVLLCAVFFWAHHAASQSCGAEDFSVMYNGQAYFTVSSRNGTTLIAGPLQVGGLSSFPGGVTVGSTLTVTGPTLFGTVFAAAGITSTNGLALTQSGYLRVESGIAQFLSGATFDNVRPTFPAGIAGPVTMIGPLTASGGLAVSGAATFNDGLTVPVGQTAAISGSLTVGGPSTFTGLLTANGGIATTTLTASGVATFNGALTASSTSTFNGVVAFNQNVAIAAGRTVTAGGPVNLNAGATVASGQTLQVNGDLNVVGTSIFTGRVGLGGTVPNADLQFSNTLGNRKVTLYEFANNQYQYYGFGIQSNTLLYSVPGTTDSHVFVAGAGTTSSTELMRIAGSGNVGIGNPAPSYKLDVNGVARAKAYKTAIYNAGGVTAGSCSLSTCNCWQDYCGLVITFNLAVQTTVLAKYTIAGTIGNTHMVTRLILDGADVGRSIQGNIQYSGIAEEYWVELAAGSHTFRVQYRTPGGGLNNPAGQDHEHRILQVVVFGN